MTTAAPRIPIRFADGSILLVEAERVGLGSAPYPIAMPAPLCAGCPLCRPIPKGDADVNP